jgi:hypothetical protein
MTKDVALQPIEQRTVQIRGDEITAVLVENDDGQHVYVPVRPLCDYLEVSWAGQRQRLQRDPVLGEALRSIRVTQARAGEQGGTITTEMLCLPLKLINGWLFGINANRVREDLREKVIQYQRECYDILAEAFGVSETGLVSSQETASSPQTASLIQIRDVALAVAQITHEMILHEERLSMVEGSSATLKNRLDEAARYIGSMDKRLTQVEERTDPRNAVTEDQADAIQVEVLALADLIAEYNPSPPQKSYHQTVYGQLYKLFGISNYRRIRQKDYDRVLAFLQAWRERLLRQQEE